MLGQSGLFGEVDDDSVVLTQLTVTIGVTANNGAVVDISSGDFLHVGTGKNGTETNFATIVLILHQNSRNLGTGVVEVGYRGSNQINATDDPTFGDNSVSGEA